MFYSSTRSPVITDHLEAVGERFTLLVNHVQGVRAH